MVLIITVFYNKLVNNEAVSVTNDWIIATQPLDNDINVPLKSSIHIFFNQDMNIETLNENNIKVLDEKHGDRIISNLFNYVYDNKGRILTLKFKNPDSDYGTGNSIKVIVSGKVLNLHDKPMNNDYVFSFQVSDN